MLLWFIYVIIALQKLTLVKCNNPVLWTDSIEHVENNQCTQREEAVTSWPNSILVGGALTQ